MIDYNAALESSKDSSYLEDDDLWELIEPELSFSIWKLWKSFDFQIDLWPGGVLAWPEWFVHDAAIINWLNRMARRDMGFD